MSGHIPPDDHHDEPDDGDSNLTPSTPRSDTPIPPDELASYYIRRHGRTFHTFPAPYFLPCDEAEWARLDTEHTMLQTLLGNHFFGPVHELLTVNSAVRKRVLDLGCGSGLWVEEMAGAYPHVSFYGADLIPVHRHQHDVRFECYELVAPVQRPIRLDAEYVSVVHARNISFGLRSYEALVADAFRVLKPGGLFLSVELDLRPNQQVGMNAGNMAATFQLLTFAMNCATVRGVGAGCDPTLIPQMVMAAGFTDLTVETAQAPVGVWQGSPDMQTIGHQAQAMLLGLAESLKPELRALDGLTGEVVDELVHAAQTEILSGEVEWSLTYHLLHARKPAGS